MFVLPPPPRYPAQQYAAGANSAYGINGAPIQLPLLETNNLISHPTGPEAVFFAGEGQYTLREDILLATPPPHPSEAPVANPNPLATNSHPPTAGTKISTIIIKSRPVTHAYGNPASVINGPSNIDGEAHDNQEKISEPRTSLSTDEGSDTNGSRNENGDNSVPNTNHAGSDKFGGGNNTLTAMKDAAKRKKPKNNIVKSNSSFVSRIIQHENLTKRLSERATEDLFVFANVNRAFNWLDLSSVVNKQESLSKILFTKFHPLCHDVNEVTKSANHIDVIMGFNSGDIIWFDPMSNKYSRINKNGSINTSPVLDIRWLPGSENLFIAAHQDGALVVYDKEKDDAAFVSDGAVAEDDKTQQQEEATSQATFITHKSVNSNNQKFNPVAFWSISKYALNAFAISPDGKHIAIVSEDGSLHIVNMMKEHYYGGLVCVCWSPDGRYVVTGGQDDLVSIWSFAEHRLVARCNGHHSWVTSVAFDPWRCDNRTYRFGSVGEDCRLLLWDFSVGMLTRPKAASTTHRGSISSTLPYSAAGRNRAESQSGGRFRADSIATSRHDEDVVVHPVETRARTSILPPIMSKIVDVHPLSMLQFREDSIITTCIEGHIRTWDRPSTSKVSTNEAVTLPAVPEV